MRVLYDFVCDHCLSVEERLVDNSIMSVPCKCGYVMYRVIPTPTVSLEGITGAFPGAHERWAKIREDKAKQDRSISKEHGSRW